MAYLTQQVIDAAIDQLNTRFPNGAGIAAAALLEDGTLVTSISFEPEWGAGGLCAETGAILEATRQNKRLLAIACVSRLSPDSPVSVLTPCGICQERLFNWGYDVEIAVPSDNQTNMWMMKTLGEIQPYHWVKVHLK